MITNTEHYKSLLLKEKERILSELNQIATNDGGSSWTAKALESVDNADREDVALNIEEYQEVNNTVKILETELLEIENALSKIENGKYGICEISGDQIEEDRLEANPAARTCKAHINQ